MLSTIVTSESEPGQQSQNIVYIISSCLMLLDRRVSYRDRRVRDIRVGHLIIDAVIKHNCWRWQVAMGPRITGVVFVRKAEGCKKNCSGSGGGGSSIPEFKFKLISSWRACGYIRKQVWQQSDYFQLIRAPCIEDGQLLGRQDSHLGSWVAGIDNN